MINTELKTLVIDEATKLKQFATAEELGRLDIKELDAVSLEKCIYGQMCDGCMSERALYLQSKCCHRAGLMTCIESYITDPSAQSATIIAFLKSERETLAIDDL